ncbi:hypothetical protein BDV24DRAFT_146790 [Aspergillus arachidicola]|uniref:Chitinase n=1 Tax=Aspergillus arachidicola TaxID=656916 RepID=A0A5N6YNZ6_9EURO|nr:hypothetical protein BDV24DRAFT_146790 [Aspergillus arachidicola]
MVFSRGPKWHLLSLLFACFAGQVLSQSVSKTEKCSGASSKQRYIGYYFPKHFEFQDCETLEPSDINVEPFTHLYLVSNNIGGGEGPIAVPQNDIDRRRWKDFVNLKIKKPSLKTFLSVAPFSTPPWLFDGVGSSENWTSVIDFIVKVMNEFKFDGFDLSGEWSDLWREKNSVNFLKELRGLRNIDLPGMFRHLDHATFRSEDAAIVPHVERSVRLFRQANIDLNKLSPILDLSGYESDILDPECKTPGCPLGTPQKRGKVEFQSARSLKAMADLANENCLGGLAVGMISTGGPATLANPNDLDPSNTSMRGAPPTNLLLNVVDPNANLTETDTPSAASVQSDSLSTETSNNDTDTNANTEGLACHPAIGSVHVPIAQQDCDSNSTSTASHKPDPPVNAKEHTPSPTLAAPHEAGTSGEPNAMGPKPTLTLAHRIGTPTDTAEKANDEGTTPGEPANAP